MAISWNATNHADRRREQRVEPTGIAIIRTAGWVSRARIVDLSTGGACLRTEATLGEGPNVDDRSRIELRLDRCRNGLDVRGRIRRHRRRDHVMAIAFDYTAPELEDAVHDHVVRTLEADDSTVLVIDPADDRRAILVADLLATRFHVVEARTPLEAIFRLEDSRARVAVIAIADTIPRGTANNLRRFVARTYPVIRIARAGVDDVVSAMAMAVA